MALHARGHSRPSGSDSAAMPIKAITLDAYRTLLRNERERVAHMRQTSSTLTASPWSATIRSGTSITARFA